MINASNRNLYGKRETAQRDISCRSLSLRSDGVDAEQRSFALVLATEQTAEVWDWNRYAIIDETLLMRGVELPETAQVPLLENHYRYALSDQLGSVRELRVDNEQLLGRGYLTDGDDAAESAWRKISQGHLTDVSVGYRVLEYVDLQPGESRVIEGRQFKARKDRALRVTTRWRVQEGSLVPIGADEAAKIKRELAKANGNSETSARDGGFKSGGTEENPRQTFLENRDMNKALRAYLLQLGMRAEATETEAWQYMQALVGDQRAEAERLKTAGEGSNPANTDPQSQRGSTGSGTPNSDPPAAGNNNTEAVRAAAIAEERQRVTQLREMAGECVAPEVLQRAIDDGWSTERAGREFLTNVREQRSEPVSTPAIMSHSHDQLATERAIAAGFVQRAGLSLVDPRASESEQQEQARQMEQGHRFRNMSLLDACREACRISGVRVNQYDRTEVIRGAVSTATLTHIFTSTVGARLLTSFRETPDTTEGLVRVTTLNDFKTNERKLLGKTGNLTRHERGGEAEHATFGDSGEEYKAYRYSKQFSLDEQDIIDDSFDALLTLPAEMGAAARRLRPDLVYSILLANANMADGVALFHATRNNLATGSGSALEVAGLEAALIAMSQQTHDGQAIDVIPRFLVIPPTLQFKAKVLLKSQERVIAADSGGTYNPFTEETLRVVAERRLSASGATDPVTGTRYSGSNTNWWLLGDPNSAHTIEVGYVTGSANGPQLRSFVHTEGKWGIGWDIKLDIGAKALAPQGMFKAVGG